MICCECGGKVVESSDPIKETYRNEEIVVYGIRHERCLECGEITLKADALDAYEKEVARLYAVSQGLLSLNEIHSLRKNLKLTQKEFERVLGVATPTVSRWETGAITQSKPVDNLMRMMIKFPCVAEDLMERAEVGKYTPKARG